MGTNQSKEEVIIAQAGNSGGSTAGIEKIGLVRDVIGLVLVVLILCTLLWYWYKRCYQNMKEKARRSVSRSQQLA